MKLLDFPLQLNPRLPTSTRARSCRSSRPPAMRCCTAKGDIPNGMGINVAEARGVLQDDAWMATEAQRIHDCVTYFRDSGW